MRKLLALLGVCCLLGLMLSGCTSTEPESDMDESATEETMGTMGTAAEDAEAAAGEAMDEAQDAAEEGADQATE